MPWEGNNLEVQYLENRYYSMQEAYSKNVNTVRRQWDTFEEEIPAVHLPTDLATLKGLFPYDDMDGLLLMLKFWNNYRWAKQKDNKFLFSEELDGFPCMNYALREGPYVPPLDAVFGAEDFHVILKGHSKNLIFLQPRVHGFAKGWYVESSL